MNEPVTGWLQFSPSVRLTDLPASAGAVSGLALQGHAGLLEEEHEGAALFPGNTPSPAGVAAGTVFVRLMRVDHDSESMLKLPGFSRETGREPPEGSSYDVENTFMDLHTAKMDYQ